MKGRIKKGWKELKVEIIDTDKCCLCGSCAAFCDNIIMTASGPVEQGRLCSENATCRDGFGACYNLCPITGRDRESSALLDRWVYEESADDKSNEFFHDIILLAGKYKPVTYSDDRVGEGHNAGFALLKGALEANIIDGAIYSSLFSDERTIVNDEKGIFKLSASLPVANAPLDWIMPAFIEGHEKLAVVGSGCEIQALRKMQNHTSFDFEVHDLVSLAIGSFCFFKPRPDRLGALLHGKGCNRLKTRGMDFDGKGFIFSFSSDDGTINIPASELYTAAKGSCFSCFDSSAHLADISIGRLDALPGWDILIVRTNRGKEVVDAAKKGGYLETRPLNAVQTDVVIEITKNKPRFYEILNIQDVGRDLKTFTFHAPSISANYKPGQFIVLWLPDVDFLPMGISGISGDNIDVTVQKVGEGTARLFDLKNGDTVGIRGPYGEGWDLNDDNYLLVGGGVGVAALTTAKAWLHRAGKKVFSLFGGRTKNDLLCTEDQDICIMTDDGSLGGEGVVTDIVERLIEQENIKHVLTCGPEIMMKKVFDIAISLGVEIQASLERKMKCCVGLCGTCCIGSDHSTPVCKQGPVFNSQQLVNFPQFGSYRK